MWRIASEKSHTKALGTWTHVCNMYESYFMPKLNNLTETNRNKARMYLAIIPLPISFNIGSRLNRFYQNAYYSMALF